MKYKYEGTGEFEGFMIESMIPKEDWKFGAEIFLYSNQPERSKREDSEEQDDYSCVCEELGNCHCETCE